MEKLKDHHLALEYLANTYGKDNGVEVSVEIENKTPVTFNTGGMFVNLERAMEDLDYPFTRVEFPTLGSEDFGEYQKHVPGVFFFLKTTPVGGAPQHNSHFEIQEHLLYKAIPLIDRLMYRWAEQMEVV
jgi:metal-dependent amidase/aminoacylase/carboxypeptidase family protein